jgi:hypothetical protein
MSDLNLKNLSAVQTDNLTVEFGERPKMAELDGVTNEHRRAGAHLAAIHRMHLHDMNRMGAFLEHLKQGKMTPAEFSNRVKDTELSKNMKMFGTLCGRECQVLNFHHDAEEQMIFPELERQNIAALSRVVERLRQEHFVVHELLRRLDVAADKLLQDTSTGNFDEITQVFEQLHKVVKSHFGYEETELRDALGKYVPVI